MNDQTAKLIEQLAAKLGTTSEYLWSILLRQAPISATIMLIQIIIVLLIGLGLWRAHKHFNNSDNDMCYNDSDGGLEVFMTVGCVVYAFLFVGCLFCVDRIINGYFNPEFWALNYILNKVGK